MVCEHEVVALCLGNGSNELLPKGRTLTDSSQFSSSDFTCMRKSLPCFREEMRGAVLVEEVQFADKEL